MQLQTRALIAALATPAGEGGIAIIRISGEGCADVLSRVFRPANCQTLVNRMLTFGRIMDGETVLDEAMAVLMRAPHSYTREDVAELHIHGSEALVRRVLLLLQGCGVRTALPGEFTYRAFMNGRVDLSQAEAVMQMIGAGSERAMRTAVRQMEGGVSAFVAKARAELIAMLADIAAATDFPDEVEESETAERIVSRCQALEAMLRGHCSAESGRIEAEGLRVVLAGLPNAGKSSLMNALLGAERAIVTDIPGTTRDTLTESFQIDGLRVHLTDTAGLRETSDAVEKIGVERAQQAIGHADVRVFVMDGSQDDWQARNADELTALRPQLIVLTHGDLGDKADDAALLALCPTASVVRVCAPKGEGLAALRERIAAFAPAASDDGSLLTQARHVQAALHACDNLTDAAQSLTDGLPLDVAAIDLSAALDTLGEITGETLNEAVISDVFSRFCVGK